MSLLKTLLIAAKISVVLNTAAAAAIISGAKISGVEVRTTGSSQNRVIISDRQNLSGPPLAVPNGQAKFVIGGNLIAAKISSAQTPGFPPRIDGAPVSYSATFVLSGSGKPGFAQAVYDQGIVLLLPTGTASPSACAATLPRVTAGGLVGTNSVTAVFSVQGNCTLGTGTPSPAPDGVMILGPIEIRAAGDVVVTATFRTLDDGQIYDGGPATATLVRAVPVYDVAVSPLPTDNVADPVFATANALPTVFALNPVGAATNPYTAYMPALAGTRDLIIGSVKATLVSAQSLGAVGTMGAPNTPTIWGNLAGEPAPQIETRVTITATNGTLAAIRPSISSAAAAPVVQIAAGAFTLNAANTSLTGLAPNVIGGLPASNVLVSTVAGNNISTNTAQSYTATLAFRENGTPNWLAWDPVTGPLETTGNEGTRFDAPWFGGSRASSQSLVRISNVGPVATDVVMLTLANPILMPGEALKTTVCQLASGLSRGGELLISTDTVTQCFGNFVRGDLRILVQGLPTSLTAKMRLVSSMGTVSEQSLGNISQGAAIPGN